MSSEISPPTQPSTPGKFIGQVLAALRKGIVMTVVSALGVYQVKPDFVLLTGTPEDLGMGTAPGLDLFSDQLREELAVLSSARVIQVARL